MSTSSTGATWDGKIFSEGWREAHGGAAAVVEPATGYALGNVGTADSTDVDFGARSATRAQVAWAATPTRSKCSVPRRHARERP